MEKVVEVNEAISAGRNVLYKADEVLSYLNSAKTWGLIDMFSDRSFLFGILKNSKINDAEAAMNDLRYSINRFNDELDDVKVYGSIDNVDIEGFVRFIDVFMDNFFVDLYAISKISDSKRQVENLKLEVNGILKQLETIK